MPEEKTNNTALIKYQSALLTKAGGDIDIIKKLLKESFHRKREVIYKSVVIGVQEWMLENLNVEHFRNGDLIPEAKTNDEWIKAGDEQSPAWCYYNNDPKNGEKYGRLYNWYAVNDFRGLAPNGWHIPSYKDWRILFSYLGGYKNANIKMKTTSGWQGADKITIKIYNAFNIDTNKYCENVNGSNESGFSSLPSGVRFDHGDFHFIGYHCYWWCSTEFIDNLKGAYSFCNSNYHTNELKLIIRKGFGYSVRCLKF